MRHSNPYFLRINCRLVCLLVCCVVLGGLHNAFGQDTFRDNFSSTSYSNNDGTLNFSAAWNEDNDDNNPSNGRIRIISNQLRFQNMDNARISRTLNLAGATSVTLTLDYNRTNGNEDIDVQLWDGSGFNTVANLAGTGSISYTLAPNEISASSEIRFITGSGNWGGSETVFVDNVLFTANFSPSISIDDVAVNEDDGVAVFTVSLQLDAPGAFSVDYATADGTAVAGSDYTTTSGTLNFLGTDGETQTITVPLIDDSIPEYLDETFTVTLSNISDPGVVILDGSGEGTISDDEYLFNTPLVLKEEFDGYVDYTTTGGTLRTQSNNTDPCAITTSSSNSLIGNIPATATIDKAILYWSHSGATPDTQVNLDGNTIDADFLYGSSLTNRTFYGGRADITTYVASLPSLSTHNFTFSGLTIDNTGSYCSTATTLGAWSIMVFYTDNGLPASTINVYEGFSGESNSSSSYTLGGFFAIGASGAKTTVLSWEGDQTLSNNELLTVTTGLGTFTLAGDGDNNGITTNNPFNSTIFDNTVTPTINNAAAYGIDLDTYDVSPYVQPGESSVTTTVQSGQDFVLVNAVVLKVPSNLVTGIVFEDLNYGGGPGRNRATAGGVPLEGVTMELYDSGGGLRETTTTNAAGRYVFGGMANGTYTIRAVNNSVRSSRTGGAGCTECFPVQTFKTDFILGALVEDTDAVGGEDPSAEDPGPGSLNNAQSRSSMTILNQGVAGMDFGFNFNTIVNTNETGQGSLSQFITNANNLDESGLDIVANALFDPGAGEDVSIFMIPPTGDALGRSADPEYSAGVFNIEQPIGDPLPEISADNTFIDGRTQTAYSGDTNSGTTGSGGTPVGVSGSLLPDFDLPEIQVHRNDGDVFRIAAANTTVRNLSIFANDEAAIRLNSGDANVRENLLGVDASGTNVGNILYGIHQAGGSLLAEANYIATNEEAGILVAGGTSSRIRDNQLSANGGDKCFDNITITGGSGIVIERNLIENAAALGIDGLASLGGITISENSITGSGQDGGSCSGVIENAGIRLGGSNSSISNNVIYSNGGAGIVLAGNGTSGNTISQNSIFANGTAGDALGIDLGGPGGADPMGDGVSYNDSGDTDNGPNGLINFPVLAGAYIQGTELIVKGWARPGDLVEVFFSDIQEGTATIGDNQLGNNYDYGEGQTFIGSATEGSGSDLDGATASYADLDGNTDTTNRFEFRFPLPAGTDIGDLLTGTATGAGSTSEFSPMIEIRVPTLITNRRITYRVNPN
ncbi:Calx-beta domain-containing protein [Robiginitalea biformata]|uniref:Calx-beta domain-containing protein n=1 Tax=Robiginitalea biformata (strain ATCC BAA-864 / DSM 15991 / KCTC 12146 / HTCC2501) TaxID=313596 RepID=A4CQ82_ROBBH|nr:Calx-beta domain-containing protein [Robiginitalea biformata]EAR14167.1 hypothetical protein RB2501_02035 [Robiginitalea biformata HTCC2501]